MFFIFHFATKAHFVVMYIYPSTSWLLITTSVIMVEIDLNYNTLLCQHCCALTLWIFYWLCVTMEVSLCILFSYYYCANNIYIFRNIANSRSWSD